MMERQTSVIFVGSTMLEVPESIMNVIFVWRIGVVWPLTDTWVPLISQKKLLEVLVNVRSPAMHENDGMIASKHRKATKQLTR